MNKVGKEKRKTNCWFSCFLSERLEINFSSLELLLDREMLKQKGYIIRNTYVVWALQIQKAFLCTCTMDMLVQSPCRVSINSNIHWILHSSRSNVAELNFMQLPACRYTKDLPTLKHRRIYIVPRVTSNQCSLGTLLSFVVIVAVNLHGVQLQRYKLKKGSKSHQSSCEP